MLTDAARRYPHLPHPDFVHIIGYGDVILDSAPQPAPHDRLRVVESPVCRWPKRCAVFVPRDMLVMPICTRWPTICAANVFIAIFRSEEIS